MKKKVLRSLTYVVVPVGDNSKGKFIVLDENGYTTNHTPTKQEIANWHSEMNQSAFPIKE